MRAYSFGGFCFFIASLCSIGLVSVFYVGCGGQAQELIRPPLRVDKEGNTLLLWGYWDTRKGYASPGSNAVEVRCDKATKRCSEAVATVLQHTEGLDIEAQVFDYTVTAWDGNAMRAVAENTMDCLRREITVDFAQQKAKLEWSPGRDCDGDSGYALLKGDPL